MAAAAGGGAGGGRREPPHTLQGLLEMAVVAGEAQPEPRQPMAEERQQWLRAAMSQVISGPGSTWAELQLTLGSLSDNFMIIYDNLLQRCLRLLAGPCPGEAAPERGLGDTGGHEGALEELCDLCESLDNANGQSGVTQGSLRGHEGALEELCDLCESWTMPMNSALWEAWRLSWISWVTAGPRSVPGPLACWAPVPRTFRKRRDGRWRWGNARPDGGAQGRPRPQRGTRGAVCCVMPGAGPARGAAGTRGPGGAGGAGGGPAEPPAPIEGPRCFPAALPAPGAPRLKAPLVQQGLIPRAVALLRSEHDGAHEHGLGVLCSLVLGCPEGLRECRDPVLGLEPLLRERRELLWGRAEFQEELEFCERLLQLCFETPPEESTMDR
ncbi:hsp70-binding protein 1-like [Zonotrichia albicollis]|uniref:hsp70-binding protein 1-like n=1 Tax=Zonotrichia albicollis TaxID=44394 RepID=UPI003D80E78B